MSADARRLVACAGLVLVTKAVVGAMFFGLLFGALDDASPAFRAEDGEQHGVAMLGYVAWALAFAVLFARTPGGRSGRDGVRFGLVVWLLYFVPMTLGIQAYFVVSPAWSALALVAGLVEALACGRVAALAYRGAQPSAARVVGSAGP